MLYDTMKQLGFSTEDDSDEIIFHDYPECYIRDVDNGCSYPEDALKFLEQLPSYCYEGCKYQNGCSKCPAYDFRKPITTCRYIAGQIFTFRKRGYLQ